MLCEYQFQGKALKNTSRIEKKWGNLLPNYEKMGPITELPLIKKSIKTMTYEIHTTIYNKSLKKSHAIAVTVSVEVFKQKQFQEN